MITKGRTGPKNVLLCRISKNGIFKLRPLEKSLATPARECVNVAIKAR